MGRTLGQVIAALPPERRERVDARYRELKQEVEGLRELRKIAGKAQLDVAAALHIKQPSVSKIEKQTDMYLSTLRNYIEAIGGELEMVVKLPARPGTQPTTPELGYAPAGRRKVRPHRAPWRQIADRG